MPSENSQEKINNYIAYEIDNQLGVMLTEMGSLVSRINNRAYYTEGDPDEEDYREYYVVRKDELDSMVEEVDNLNHALVEELQALRVLVTDYRITV